MPLHTKQRNDDDFNINKARPGTNVVLVPKENGKDTEMHVNKQFLSSFSAYFDALFNSPNFIESSSERVVIDYDSKAFVGCMEIVHLMRTPTGEMRLDDVRNLIAAADFFDLHVVRQFCEAELMGVARVGTDRVKAYLLSGHHQFSNARRVLQKILTEEELVQFARNPCSYSDYGSMEFEMTGDDLRSIVNTLKPELPKASEREPDPEDYSWSNRMLGH